MIPPIGEIDLSPDRFKPQYISPLSSPFLPIYFDLLVRPPNYAQPLNPEGFRELVSCLTAIIVSASRHRKEILLGDPCRTWNRMRIRHAMHA